MQPTIEFRGVMLFVTKGPSTSRTLSRLLIPRARPGNGGPNHPDDTTAHEHGAGLVIYGPGRALVDRVPLDGDMRVSVEAQKTGPCPVNNFDDVIPLHAVCNKGDADDLRLIDATDPIPPDVAKRVAATVAFTGGQLVGTDRSHARWSITRDYANHPLPDDAHLTLRARWSADAPVTIRIDGSPHSPWTLDSGWSAYFYNYDTKISSTPGHQELNTVEAPCIASAKRHYDDDFKWLFHLVEPPQGSLKAWMKGRKFLPAPGAKCSNIIHAPAVDTADPAKVDAAIAPPFVAPSVSTCFFAFWDES